MLIEQSRCTNGIPVKYRWMGSNLEKSSEESEEHAMARQFASNMANTQLHWGYLKFLNFNKYRIRTEIYLEKMFERMTSGGLRSGSEVVPIESAREKGLPMFEFRWHHSQRLLEGVQKEQIRHYDLEPVDMARVVFGVGMHLKDVREESEIAIRDRQNEEIQKAMEIAKRLDKSLKRDKTV
ncbi:hypothetical protein [Bifidobacterium sp. ESL0790]|uniref:hypothetical protein n=1 Tax=Bifidobacterium sp. ESL0790 TaxID=2983233 RepID=UPI0023F94478|nr:hypothetical protein [Bifidobacterium sp. ESL0790]WEV72209.1 hypothetical protein OZY47_07180 [Bifidobacterium sp. ESL0790]